MRRANYLRWVLMLLCTAVCIPGLSAQVSLPRVHILSTGGTIASTPDGLLTGDALVAAVPELAGLAEISVEDFIRIGSSSMTPQIQYNLARRIAELFSDPDLAGVVVTHGTDSLEETAFLVDLLHQDERPVVFTAAQRAASRVDTDGPRNLLNAVRIAVDPRSHDRGAMITLNDDIHAARFARKTHTLAVEAFVSVGAGKLGFVDGEDVFFNWSGKGVALDASGIEPRVDLLTLVAGSDGHLIRAAADSGARGLVVGIFGRGNIPPPVVDAMREVIEDGVSIVVVSRTGGGRVTVYERFADLGLINGGNLDGLKARVLLMLSLADSTDRDELQQIFDLVTGRAGF